MNFITHAHARFAYEDPLPSEKTAMNRLSRANPSVRLLVVAGLTAVFLLVAACASTPLAPVAALDAAKVAISDAEKANAGHFAAAELGEASRRRSGRHEPSRSGQGRREL